MTENSYTLYMHIAPNGKKYIGISKDINRRWNNFKREYKGCTYFYYAIQKYGWDNIEHKIILESLTREDAEKFEREWIKNNKSNDRRYGYNLTSGGEKQKEYTLEVRKKISDAQIGKVVSNETRIKLSNALSGRVFSESHMKKLSEFSKTRKGKKRPKDICKRISDTLKKCENLKRRVAQYSLNGDLIKQYNSIREAKKELNIKENSSSITSCLKGIKHSTAYGYQWRYVDQYAEKNIPPIIIYEKKSLQKAVLQYSLDGKLIKRFDSASGAMRELGLGRSIMHCCRGLTNTVYGYQWKYEDDESKIIQSIKVGEKRKSYNPVNQYSLDGNLIKQHESIKKAKEEFGASKKSTLISAVCNGRQKTAYGYIWKYAEEQT